MPRVPKRKLSIRRSRADLVSPISQAQADEKFGVLPCFIASFLTILWRSFPILLLATDAIGGEIIFLLNDASADRRAQMHQMGSTKAVLRGHVRKRWGIIPFIYTSKSRIYPMLPAIRSPGRLMISGRSWPATTCGRPRHPQDGS